MSSVAVRAERVSKRYQLGTGVQGRLTETIWDALERPIRSLWSGGRAQRPRRDFIWALKDVSFEVAEAEVVGVIGLNGAGKSTLLKILSRVTEPTEGYAEIHGRVGSLLEVGSGFHPDLTGRENVYLYGAILGMRQREVQRKFDDVVAFAEVDRFIDTPVKRYSSGMYMRLAFAVAAHLEPEILIVDEVLSVGDPAFQRKCLGKMEDVATGGRTVLFVSHNMAAVASLCDRAYLLAGGRIVDSGPAGDVVKRYQASLRDIQPSRLAERQDRAGDGSVRVTRLNIEDADGRGAIASTSRLKVTLDYESSTSVRLPRFAVTIQADHHGVFRLDTDMEGDLPDVLPARGTVTCITDPIQLTPGICGVRVSVYRGGHLADQVESAGAFEVGADDFFPSGRMPPRSSVVGLLHHKWTVPDSGSAAALST